jgi:hypothetical protein
MAWLAIALHAAALPVSADLTPGRLGPSNFFWFFSVTR